MRRIRALGPAAIGLAATLACVDSQLAPRDQLAVSNVPDTFALALNAADKTDSLSYPWVNSGSAASVSTAGNRGAGTATLLLRGPTGVIRYQASVTGAASGTSEADTAGTWQISLVLQGFSGQVSLQVVRAP